MERILLEEIVKFFESKQYIVNNSCVLAYDGLMVLQRSLGNVNIESVLKDMNVRLKAATGFDIGWATKDFDSSYTDEELAPYEFENTDVWSSQYMNQLDTYEMKKQYFELFLQRLKNQDVGLCV